MTLKVISSKSNYRQDIEPMFRNPSELSFEQLTDPDYRMKQLERLNKGKFSITCSKCHHCRGWFENAQK